MSAGERFSLLKWVAGSGLTDWWRATGDAIRLVIIGCLIFAVVCIGSSVYRFFFPKKNANVNKPVAVVTPFAKVDKIDQSSVQVSVDEKSWEIGTGIGALNYDNKSGAFCGIFVKKKF